MSAPLSQPVLDETLSRKLDLKETPLASDLKLYGVGEFDGRYAVVSATVGKDGKVKVLRAHFQLEEEKEFALDNLKKELQTSEGVRY